MIEFGHLLPEPGDEHDWMTALPTEDRDFMQSIAGWRLAAKTALMTRSKLPTFASPQARWVLVAISTT